MSSPFAATPTGPALSALLATFDAAALPDDQLLDLLTAESRQLAYQQARQWAVMAELATRAPGNLPGAEKWRPEQIFDAAVDEIRAELVLTRQGARCEVDDAVNVYRHPRVFAALTAGVIDRRRAIVITDGCLDLTDEQAEKLVDAVLPGATEVTATGLRDRVQRVAIALDPMWAERRYRESVRRRRVVGYLTADGTATITATGLPAEEAAAACARIAALADRAKRSGATAPIDHLRSEVCVGLLTGRFHGHTHTEIIAALIAQFPRPEGAPASEQDGGENAEPPPGTSAEPSREPCAVAGVELRVGLATLLELDDRPGEIAGWGPVVPSIARDLAEKQRRSQWRFAVLDDDGRLLFDGITRHRSPSTRAPAPAVDGGFVEVHVTALMLADPFFADEHPGWGPLIRDLTRQYAEHAPIVQDPAARFAGRPLRRHSQVKHRTCLFPGCRRPAAQCELDHREEHSRGGPTTDANLGPDCSHDHALKTTGGWRLVKRDDQTYVWISPLGREHVSRVDPVAPPLPDPMPRQQPPEPTGPLEDVPAGACFVAPSGRTPPPPGHQDHERRTADPDPPPY